MTTVFYDSSMTDAERRSRLYAGDIFVYSPRESVLAYAEFTRELLREAFAPRDPETAQFEMKVDDFAALLGKLKPEFIHHPESKRHLKRILEDFGCDLELTYFDVPRLRSSTSDQYLTSGIAYAWHPHRDTWYSAPMNQINWWFPVYELQSSNAMAFHPNYWNRGVRNDSAGYNYYEWNKRFRGPQVASLVKEETRPLPRATEAVEIEPQIRLLCPVGGMIIFSGAQMHSSVPNTSGRTRFSIDFRHVHRDDVAAQRGAPRSDEACTGTTMRDYRRGTDLAPMPEELIRLYDDDTAASGKLVYEHRGA
jgi:Phytanoyl-CoA dioxygenase (PhyH)